MYRIQANLDQKAVFFLPRHFFIINFPREKIIKKHQYHNILGHEGYLLSKDQVNTLDQRFPNWVLQCPGIPRDFVRGSAKAC